MLINVSIVLLYQEFKIFKIDWLKNASYLKKLRTTILKKKQKVEIGISEIENKNNKGNQ